ncbi:hypothetical protein DB346_14800 [Verrucomicrobia bacterium LW23]|nr:hypothetical protein DB346_14800 [Verrucomicrobia bacterium LW23]
MNIVVAVTGASGAIYAQRLLEALALMPEHRVHLLVSTYAKQVIAEEIGELRLSQDVVVHGDKSMNVPFASGSTRWDCMVIIPCTMGTVGRIAHGVSDSTITRTADVFLKERRKLVIVPRETPWNLIHARNVVTLLEAGADVIPAAPSFYNRPQTIMDVIDTVIARVLDHMGVEHNLSRRWMEGNPPRNHHPTATRREPAHPPQHTYPQHVAPAKGGADAGQGQRFGGYVSAGPTATQAAPAEDVDIDNRKAGQYSAMMQILHEDENPAPPPMAPPTADTLPPEPPFWEVSGDEGDDRRSRNHGE